MTPQEFNAEMPAEQLERSAPARATTARKYIDCSAQPSAKQCSLMIVGTEEEVMAAALSHATSPMHGHKDTPALHEALRKALRDVPAEGMH